MPANWLPLWPAAMVVARRRTTHASGNPAARHRKDSMRQRITNLRRRYPVAFGLGLGIFLAAGAAAAAFVIYSLNIGGTGTGQFAAGTTQSAVQISETGTAPALDSGTQVNMAIHAVNIDPDHQHMINVVGGTFTTKTAGGADDTSTCASHLSTGTSTLDGTNLTLGGTADGTIPIKADATTPGSCAAGSYTVTFTGTTS
jgi:hypothetical protein